MDFIILISCDGADIESALIRLGCIFRSSLIFERIRNKDGELTRFLTGRRFIFVDVPSNPLERSLRVGGLTARLYHKRTTEEREEVNTLLQVSTDRSLSQQLPER